MKIRVELKGGKVSTTCAYCNRPSKFPVERSGVGHPRASVEDEGVLWWSTSTRCSSCSALYTVSGDADGVSLEFAFAPDDPVWTAHRLTWSASGALAFAKYRGPTFVVAPRDGGWRFVARIEGSRPVAFAPGGDALVVQSADDGSRISLYRLDSRRSVDLPPAPLSSRVSDRWRVAWDRTGRFLVLLGSGKSGLEAVVIDVARGAARIAKVAAPDSESFEISRAGDRIVAHWPTGRRVVAPTDIVIADVASGSFLSLRDATPPA